MPDGTLISAPLACCDTAPGLLPLAAARERLLRAAVPVVGEEALPPGMALGRVLAAAPRAALSLPPFDQSAMDGYALHAADLAPGAAPRVARRITAGEAAGPAIGAGEAVRVLTGAALPPGAAAVVMEEHVALRDGRVSARRLPRPGANIRRRGEDLAEGDILLAPGMRLDARHVALLAAAGVGTVAVRRQVRVALLSNGNELGTAIRDSNRPMLAALLARPEVTLTDLGVLPDDPEALAAALRGAAVGHDLILASGGISGSDADHLPGALRAAGGEAAVLKLALKPGKPLAHGRIGGALCLFLPGNPLAALVGMLTLGRPLLARLAGLATEMGPAPLAAVAAAGFSRKPGREEFLPARIIDQDGFGLPLLEPSGPFGSARLTPLAAADGLLWLPAATERVAPGDMLRFHPFAASFGLA
ncbi:molybdopterin molybdotransferase MoeA [Roseicella aerolata]|uniref:Molybdopterin molybdenumtransferase n=1 Tax=Roseicella aerolata TaxID=2883479 RepID=A0A9X1L682_9PROT|nr:molybdopterin molybdotransferase MoeA [Roseicella aerolata]MCB4820284.1 molybdopterin molybdotransferase MoeA [Roseicella aerolata]